MYCTVWETEHSLQGRFSEHKGYAINQTNKTTGEHFRQKGHRVFGMRVTILEKKWFLCLPRVRNYLSTLVEPL